MNQQPVMQIQLARTLWENTYRGRVLNDSGEYIATLRIFVCTPLDRSELPENAPNVQPYLTTLVEDAVLPSDDILEFEKNVADMLINRFSNEHFIPNHCQFCYPSPPDLFTEEKALPTA